MTDQAESYQDFFSLRIDQSSAARAWVGVAAVHWIEPLVDRIERLGEKADGWRGPGSVGASQQAVEEAIQLVERLALEVPYARPKVGLEEDGDFSFFWRSEEGLASVSLSGDGMYSFYLKRGGKSILVPEAPLVPPLDHRLLEALAIIC